MRVVGHASDVVGLVDVSVDVSVRHLERMPMVGGNHLGTVAVGGGVGAATARGSTVVPIVAAAAADGGRDGSAGKRQRSLQEHQARSFHVVLLERSCFLRLRRPWRKGLVRY